MLGGIPPVEATDHGHTDGIGCPHREGGAPDLSQGGLVGLHIRTEHIPQALVATLRDEVGVHLTEGGQEDIGVGGDHGFLLRPGDPQAVIQGLPVAELDGEDVITDGVHDDLGITQDQLDLLCADLAGADHRTVGGGVPTIETVGVVVAAVAQPVEILFGDQQVVRGSRGHDIRPYRENPGVFSGFDCFDATAVRAPAYGIYARYLSIWRQARRSRRAAGSSGRTKIWATSLSGSRRTKLVAPQV